MGRALEEMRGKDSRELRYELETTRKSLFEARVHQASESTKPSDIGNMRRKIARILTILKEREKAEKAAAASKAGEANES